MLAQFPELAGLIKSSLSEYKDALEKIIVSDDESTNQVYGILNKEIESAGENEMESVHIDERKDTEKKAFNWKVIGSASFAVLTAIRIGASALGVTLT